MKKEILLKLASAANALDQKGATKLAVEITDIMLKVAQTKLPLPPIEDEVKAQGDVLLLERDFKNIQVGFSTLPKIEQNIRENLKQINQLQINAHHMASDNPQDPRHLWADSKMSTINQLQGQLRDLKNKMSNTRFFDGKEKLAFDLESFLQNRINRTDGNVTAGEIYDELFLKDKKAANILAAALKNLGYVGWRTIKIQPGTFLTNLSKEVHEMVLKGRALEEKQKQDAAAIAKSRQMGKSPY